MKTILVALLVCLGSLSAFAQGQLSVVGQKYRLVWDANPETNIVSYVVAYSSTNQVSTNLTTLGTVTVTTNEVSIGSIFAGVKSGSYTLWVAARNSEGLQSVWDSSASLNVYWFPPVTGLRIVPQK